MLADWEEEKFFDNADAYFSSLLFDLKNSRSEILFETYIFKKCKIGTRLITELEAAVERGVDVRLMVDGFGSSNFFSDYGKSLKKLEVRAYHPVPWAKYFSKTSINSDSKYFPTGFFHLFGSLNSRNHRKVCLIDRKIAYLGSINVSDDHLTEVRGKEAWRDYGVLVRGKCVEALVHAFDKAWRKTLRERLRMPNFRKLRRLRRFNKYFLLNHSTNLRRKSRLGLLRRISHARSQVTLVTPYFVPTVRLLAELSKAAKRGVIVKIILPRKNDVPFMRWVMQVFYDVMLRRGIQLYEFLPTVLHAKVVVVDKWCAIGSTNLNSRSIFHDLESNYILQTDKCKLELESALSREIRSSEQVKTTRAYPWYERWIGRLLLVFRYWI